MYWPVGFAVYWWSGNLKEEKEGPKWETMMINEIKEIGSMEFKKNVCIVFLLNVFIAKDYFLMTLYIWERHCFTCVLCWVAQLYPTLCNIVECSLPGSFVHGDSPGKNTAVGCRAFLQGIFPMQGSNPVLLHCRWILHCLSNRGSPSHL